MGCYGSVLRAVPRAEPASGQQQPDATTTHSFGDRTGTQWSQTTTSFGTFRFSSGVTASARRRTATIADGGIVPFQGRVSLGGGAYVKGGLHARSSAPESIASF